MPLIQTWDVEIYVRQPGVQDPEVRTYEVWRQDAESAMQAARAYAHDTFVVNGRDVAEVKVTHKKTLARIL